MVGIQDSQNIGNLSSELAQEFNQGRSSQMTYYDPATGMSYHQIIQSPDGNYYKALPQQYMQANYGQSENQNSMMNEQEMVNEFILAEGYPLQYRGRAQHGKVSQPAAAVATTYHQKAFINHVTNTPLSRNNAQNFGSQANLLYNRSIQQTSKSIFHGPNIYPQPHS